MPNHVFFQTCLQNQSFNRFSFGKLLPVVVFYQIFILKSEGKKRRKHCINNSNIHIALSFLSIVHPIQVKNKIKIVKTKSLNVSSKNYLVFSSSSYMYINKNDFMRVLCVTLGLSSWLLVFLCISLYSLVAWTPGSACFLFYSVFSFTPLIPVTWSW